MALALWRMLPPGRCRALLIGAAALIAASAGCALVPAIVVAVIAAVVFDRIDIGLTVTQLVFVGISAVIARLGLQLSARNLAGAATEFLSQSLRARAAVTIGALPLGTIAELPPGSFETVLLDDVERLGQYVSEGLIDHIGALAMLVAAAAVVGARNWEWGAAAVALTVAAGALARPGGRRATEHIERERAAREKLSVAIFGRMRALPLALSLPVAPDVVNPVRALADEDSRATDVSTAHAAGLRVRRGAIATSLPAAIVLAVVAFGRGAADLPLLVLFAALGLRTSGALACVFRASATATPAFESLRRIRALLARPPLADGATPLPADTTLRFSHVDFSYPAVSGGRMVLRDIDFVADPGRVTAIVGPSGSGKTTLTRLAARLWDVDNGSVTIGGVDVRSVGVDALMQRVSCVFQDVALLDDTVAANLRLGRTGATDGDMIGAATAAGAHDFIMALPYGYETIVGDRGLFLSRGERQRLQIARALLKDAPIVILDEPTASMDPATECDIQAALAPLLRDKTVLVVAHRLATIASADRIVVLDRDGRIEAQGRHVDLLAKSATYAGMWADYRASADWTSAVVTPSAS